MHVEVLLLAVPPVIGYLFARWWVVPALGGLFVVWVAAAAIVDNYVGACTRPDGCGPGPVAQALLLGLIIAALIMGLTAAGCYARQRREAR